MAMKAIQTQEVESTIVGNWTPQEAAKTKAGKQRPAKRLIGVAILERQTDDTPEQSVVLVEEVTFPATKTRGKGERLNFILCHGDEARKNRTLFEKGPKFFYKVCELRASEKTDIIFSHDMDGNPTYSKVPPSDLGFMYIDGDCLGNATGAHTLLSNRILSGEMVEIIDCSQAEENRELFDLI